MAKQAKSSYGDFPFVNGDFAKMWSEFKVPTFDIESMVAAQRKNLEAVSAANQAASEGFQAVAKRQTEIVQETVAEWQKGFQALSTADGVQDAAAKQAELTKAAYAKALTNAKELSDLVTHTSGEAFEVVNKRVVESFDEVKTAFERFSV